MTAFALVMRSQLAVRWPFVNIPGGGKPSPQAECLQAAKNAFFHVPGGDKAVLKQSIGWLPDTEVLMFFPLHRNYKDFIMARTTRSTLYIFFVSCTIQLPEAHPLGEWQLYQQWETLWMSSSKTTNCYSYRNHIPQT